MLLEKESECFKEVRKQFPNAKSIPVAGWNISHIYYEDDKYEKIVAESYYVKINYMNKWDVFGGRNLQFFDNGYTTKFVKYII